MHPGVATGFYSLRRFKEVLMATMSITYLQCQECSWDIQNCNAESEDVGLMLKTSLGTCPVFICGLTMKTSTSIGYDWVEW